MIYIGKFKEFNPNYDFPSIRDCFSEQPYEGQNRIIDYLKHGNRDMVRFSSSKDVITGEPIPMQVIGMNDGEYTWFNTLAYYVERYNLRLPREFEEKILS